MLEQILPALLGFIVASVLAIVGAVVGFTRHRAERKTEQEDQQKTLLNALFGELANMFRHYSYACFELPTSGQPTMKLTKHLEWSKYGEVHSTRDLTRYGFLNAEQVSEILQIGLTVRNNDTFFDLLLGSLESVQKSDLDEAQKRMAYTANRVRQLMDVIRGEHPQLNRLYEATLSKE